ncbi:MAG: ABC transporter substrate-binding protein [Treponema sp.]|jgi:putative spermidine/putrescine transport system substrate-binding protein|nr:ABC transporter substrate-binding protein [Treponema sp.]
MKKNKWVFFVVILLGIAALSGCKKEAKQEKGTLVLSTWGLSEDILWRDVFGPFEEAYNCTIVLELGATAERYTKLESNPNSTIDLIELSQKASADGYGAGILSKVDYSKVPNAASLIPGAKTMIASGYGPAYCVNSIGIIYNPQAINFEIKEWADLWRPELANRISIPDITTTFGPAMVYVAGDYAKTPVALDKGAAAFKALGDLKKNVVKTYSRSSDLANMFTSGEIAAAVVGDFAIPLIIQALPEAKFVVPLSGTYANFNTIDIAANAKNKELALAFINWRISREVQSKTVFSINEAPTNSEVILQPEESRNITYGDVAQRAQAIDYTLVNPLMPQWIDTWNRTLNN